MTTHQARSMLLKTFIGFLILTALTGIVSVLMGDFGELQLKVMATTFSISAASICAMSCAAFIEKRSPVALGWTGLGICFVGEALLLIGMWAEVDGEFFWKSTLTMIVLGLGFAHALLLQLPRLDEGHDWVQPVAGGCIAGLAAMIIAAFWGEVDNEGYYRVMIVVSIIVVLVTLVIPVLMKLAKPMPNVPVAPAFAKPETDDGELVLTKLDGDYYQDASGAKYRVERVP